MVKFDVVDTSVSVKKIALEPLAPEGHVVVLVDGSYLVRFEAGAPPRLVIDGVQLEALGIEVVVQTP